MTDLFKLLGFDSEAADVKLARQMTRGDRRLVDKLIEIRRRRRLTQSDLARLMGVSQSAVAKFENGPRDPRLSTIRRYALALGVEVAHQVRGEDCSAEDDVVRRSGAVIREIETYLATAPHPAAPGWRPAQHGGAPGMHWEGDVDLDPPRQRRRSSV